ncbi:MAG: LEA type 2 family protein [Chloroherpetonaceae bacterium]|nr:LEA type 2 family protein [Chloroherpetonaceae bacterium]MDW8436637.1 LEA type 2 family protein [Chloroherpetonaceae bacterium]
MNARLVFLSCLVSSLVVSGCSVIRQIQEMKNFARCEFRLATVENLTLAGINVQRVKSARDLSIADAARFAMALSQSMLPLNFTLNVDVKNPNAETASLNRMEWRLFIDDIELLNGVVENKVSVAGNGGVSTLPLQLSVDLKKALSGRSGEAIGNFALNLAGEGNRPTRFMLRIKPTIDVLGYPIEYPDYFDVRTEFTAGMGKQLREGLTR